MKLLHPELHELAHQWRELAKGANVSSNLAFERCATDLELWLHQWRGFEEALHRIAYGTSRTDEALNEAMPEESAT